VRRERETGGVGPTPISSPAPHFSLPRPALTPLSHPNFPLPFFLFLTFSELERRLAYLQERQAAYDAHFARARHLPSRGYDEHAFVRHLDSVMHGNELTERATHKVAMHDAMLHQKAQARHFEWTKRVYEPIQASVSGAVDREFSRIHDSRRRAMDTYLDATRARNVYLDDVVKPGEYDPYALRRTAGIRAAVKVVDPLKRVVEKTWEEFELVHRPTNRRSRAKDTLNARLWTKEAMEATPHGHFEAKDLAGGVQMAFAGKDNESSVAFMDYDAPLPRDAGTGRAPGIDAEFPKGKRVLPYPYRFQDSTHTVAHPNVTRHIYAAGEAHTDLGGTRLDTTIADVMRAAK
jgi:hypothetical protein